MENQKMSYRPADIYGDVTTAVIDGRFQKLGKIRIWENERKPNDRRPPLTGYVEIQGKRYRLGIWRGLQQQENQYAKQ